MRAPYRTPQDVETCRQIHKRYGTTYYYSTLRFPAEIKWRVHGLYAFVRVPDEWVDNPSQLDFVDPRQEIEGWRSQMVKGIKGTRPDHPALRVFCDAVQECGLPVAEAHLFLDAMIMDLDRNRYQTYEDLRDYMRGSAAAVGVLMCHAMGGQTDEDSVHRAKALGEAMQLTNFLRDIREDYDRGRIYLPQEDLSRYGVTEGDIAEGRNNDSFKDLMRFEIERARQLYAYSDPGITRLPAEARKAVLLARILYSQILDRIEDQNYDVFSRRARTNIVQKASWALRVAVKSDRILANLSAQGSPG